MCRYEDNLREKGTPRDKIRPPRFKQEGSPDYPGGSKDVECALCPVKRGIFKQISGDSRWVHLVCALWQAPEVTVAHEDAPDAVRRPRPPPASAAARPLRPRAVTGMPCTSAATASGAAASCTTLDACGLCRESALVSVPFWSGSG